MKSSGIGFDSTEVRDEVIDDLEPMNNVSLGRVVNGILSSNAMEQGKRQRLELLRSRIMQSEESQEVKDAAIEMIDEALRQLRK